MIMIVKTPGSEQDVMVLTERLKVLALESIDPFKSIFKNRKNRNRFNRFKSI